MTLRAIGSSSGSEGRSPESLRSRPGESKLPLEAQTELSAEVDVERVEANKEVGNIVEALVVLALVSFFFLTGGQAADDET